MDLSVVFVLFVAGTALGAAFAYFAFAAPARGEASKERAAREGLAVEKAGVEAVAARVPVLEEINRQLQGRFELVNSQLSEAKAILESERKAAAARVEELKGMEEEIQRKFAVLASDALGKNSENFLALMSERFETHKLSAAKDLEERQKAIETLVKPIGESLSKFERQVGELEKAREGAYGAIAEQVKSLAEGQIFLRTETGRLVQALRQPKTRGRWGEYQLRNVLEMAGMTEHVDFVEEKTIEGSGLEGREGNDARLRPDVIVRLPGGKCVVVDAKTPLEAYLAATEAADESVRVRLMANHASQVRNHVRSLASKEYWKALPETPDLVVMFVPGEAFVSAAFEADPELFELAARQHVLISGPVSLIALLRTVAYSWRQERQARNSQAVAELARELFERIKIFGVHVGDLGQSLRQAVDRYNKAVGSLEGRVLPAARKFESLGVVSAGSVIEEIDPVETEPRELQAAELTYPSLFAPPAEEPVVSEQEAQSASSA